MNAEAMIENLNEEQTVELAITCLYNLGDGNALRAVMLFLDQCMEDDAECFAEELIARLTEKYRKDKE